jgi:arylsulfatase A-like enzyme
VWWFGVAAAGEPATRRPDIVVVLSDDHTWRDSSVYGSPDIKTPHMQRLAAVGMTFDNAFVVSPSCAPSRAALLTGLYPARNGAEPNHSRPRADIKKLPAYLQELGYEVVAFGKVGHYRQTTEYGFDIARHFTYHEDVAIPEAVKWLKSRKSDKPLCLFVGTNWPHVPWPEQTEGIDEQSLQIPPNHVATPVSRHWRARYVAAVDRMDRDLGAVIDAAREVLGDDAIIVHSSDHGAQWPFGKWTLYDDGIRTPLIVSWPGHIAAGVRTDAMVSWIDILPTLVELAGGQPPADIDGRSFAGVLRGETDRHRDLIFATHSGDGSFNVYPTRSVSTPDGSKYIRNVHPEFLFQSHTTDNRPDGGYWKSWVKKAETVAAARRKVDRYQVRPGEELYDTGSDPYEQQNLISSDEHRAKADELRRELDAWIEQTGDELKVFGEPQRHTESEPPR